MPHPSSLAASPKPPILAFVWDNFGPLHDDRVAATARLLARRAEVVGVEINGRSDVYSWANEATSAFRKVTLLPDSDLGTTPDHVLFSRTLASLRQLRATHVFLCHYERRGIAGLAYVLRATGRKVFVMGCSKFDDHPRSAVREALKLPFLWPYQGGLVGSEQTRAFLAFLGRSSMPMELGYNTVSVDRIRALAQAAPPSGAPAQADGIDFEARDFVILARLVPKKNLASAIAAYAAFRRVNPESPRKLRICGDGPLERDLREQARTQGVEADVVFHGFLQSHEMAPVLARAAALVLVSREEQFGNVVPEALALGIPLLLSDACGARYELLRSGVNGYLVEPENVAGIADAMGRIVSSRAAWEQLRENAHALAPLGDVARFAEGVRRLVFGPA